VEANGWLLDVYPLHDRMVLWIRTAEGKLLRLEDRYAFPLYATGPKEVLKLLGEKAVEQGFAKGYCWAERKELGSGRNVEALALQIADYDRLPRFLRKIIFLGKKISFFNCDLPLSQYYLYLREIFPLGRCGVEFTGSELIAIYPQDSPWTREYEIPDLSTLELFSESGPWRPLGKGNALAVRCDGRTLIFDTGAAEDLLFNLNRLLRLYDPDLILTDYGDSFLIPALLRLSRRRQMQLFFDREPTPIDRSLVTEGRSYFTYGKIVYHGPDYPFFGRLHIDRENSFFYAATGWEGVCEVARLSKIPVQRLARRSPGTAISSMQLDRALQEKILIPWRKGEPEKFKTAWDLLVADKGGLTFQPPLGLYEEVAEIDFSSMYPTIMVQHNISAETILCSCCPQPKVPEVGYNICEQREGLVPKTLRPILERRRYFKSRKKATSGSESEIYTRRQTALKWLLVVCFGYLGYRNARFGRIEAHEAVTAYGREKLLQAKEISETHGFRVLHALTDALWITKPGLNHQEVLELCSQISRVTEVPIELEGLYKWIIFLPAKQKKDLPVANRYFGVMENGELKARGLAFRRHDTPPLIKEAQQEMLDLLRTCENRQEYENKNGQIREVMENYLMRLHTGDLKNEELLVAKSVRQNVEAYKVDNLTALALRQLAEGGIRIHPGEKIYYLIREAQAKNKEERVRVFPFLKVEDGYDEKKYRELLQEAAKEIIPNSI